MFHNPYIENTKKLIIDKKAIANFISNLNKLGYFLPSFIENEDKKQFIKNLDLNISKEMIGQSHAITIVSEAVKRNFVGFKRKNKPVASFLFCGPTGVGKTELSKLLCKYVYSDLTRLIRIDMSEYMEKASVSKLIGAAPGYVGYESGGQLTSKISEMPESVVLLDEIEKADPQVLDIFLQILDEAHLTDSQGKKVFFTESIVIFTSNVGSNKIFDWFNKNTNSDLTKLDLNQLKLTIQNELGKYFRPEFLNRLDDIIVFYPLLKQDISRILDLDLNKKIENIKESQQYLVDVSLKAKNFLLDKGFNYKFGARSMKRVISSYFESGLANYLLYHEVPKNKTIFVDLSVEKDSLFFYH